MVEGAVPGDVVDAVLLKKKKGAWLARLHRLVNPSPARTAPKCHHFGSCGGCKWQQLDYSEQLKWKQKQTEDALLRIGGLSLPSPEPILGCDAAYGYRNKVEFTFSTQRWLTYEELQSGKQFDTNALGFHAPGRWDRVLHIDECHIADPLVNSVRNELARIATTHFIPFQNLKLQTGFLRNVVFRTSRATGERMLLLVVRENKPEVIELLFTHLSSLFPQVTEWLYCVNGKANDAFADQPLFIWRGKGYITERLGEFEFRVGPVSFFQTNTGQAEKLYAVVRNWLSAHISTLYDLYCGTGSIGIFCSPKVERIVGVEYVPSAVDDARGNAEHNNVVNAAFFAGDIARLLTPQFVAENGVPDAVVTDPPRNGMDEAVVKQLLEMEPPTIIYVSCKPSTQARDVALMAHKYRVARWQPVDMFPHTSHIENVLLLERN
jgi:23S rRNA (uracil1939-C5)-methyltransferase